MPTITIDGQACRFQGKKTILQVALENGIEIPHYCYHDALSVVASCRICLAEVAQPNPRNDNKLELVPKLLPACQTPAADGAEVYTTSEKSQANQKAVMEYLLINHPLDCPVCDQAGECHLQDYSYRYGRGHSRFEETKIKQPKKDVGPNVYLYSDRCIMCTRCVRFTREVTGTSELCVTGRGNTEEIDVFPGKALDNELSVNVCDICPVGALLDKNFLFERRVWELTGTPGIDGLTSSGDNVWIDHADGRVYRFRPRVNMDVNTWWISDEIRYAWRHAHDENRLTWPAVKGNEKADWNEALAAAVEGFKKTVEQGKRVLAMISPMLTCEDAFTLATAVRAIDGQALLAVGPVPIDGEDKTFPGGYTVRAEKAPNARGVKRVLEQVAGAANVLDYPGALGQIGSGNVGAALITGNYPTDWPTDVLLGAMADPFVVLIDTLPTKLTERADVVLPGAVWVEKAGTFENYRNRLQCFERAIRPVEFARAEAQIGLDLQAGAGVAEPQRYDAEQTRAAMGGVFTSDVHQPTADERPPMPVEYVEL